MYKILISGSIHEIGLDLLRQEKDLEIRYAPELPNELLNQLKNGGILVIPVGDGKEQKMLKIRKDIEGEISQEEFGTFKFVPMLERKVR